MSFSFEFHCAPTDVDALLATRGDVPTPVAAFIRTAIKPLTSQSVWVKASGHLEATASQGSSACIQIEPGKFTAGP